MITIITGQPGNGKTLMAMDLMRLEYERNAEAVKQGKEQPRRFFSNVAGATTEENPQAFPWVERMPDHNDWTKLPRGSFVQLDEAHSDGQTPGLERYGNLFPSTGKPGESNDPRIRAMSTHRHGGYDLQLVTQWPSKIHHQVRTLAGLHVHMSRAFGLERAGVLKWTRVQADPYDEAQREKAEEEIWKFPTDLYCRYTSATLHTSSHKFRVPPTIWKGLSVLVAAIIIGWVFLSWIKGRTAVAVDKAKQAGAQPLGPGRAAPATAAPPVVVPETAPATGRYFALTAPPVPNIVGYIDSPKGCRMWGDNGRQLDIPTDECRRLVAQGLPIHFLQEERGRRTDRKDKDAPDMNPAQPVAAGTSTSFGTLAAYGSLGVGGGADAAPVVQPVTVGDS